MRKFLVLDRSLMRPGGHHYDHAVLLLRAAAEAGYQTTLVASRRFQKTADLPGDCQVFSWFRWHSYSRYVSSGDSTDVDVDVASATPSPGERSESRSPLATLSALWRRWGAARDRRRRREHVDDMVAAVGRLLRRVDLESGDLVVLPTIVELDLIALVRALATFPDSAAADWHAEFHVGPPIGRDGDDAKRRRLLDKKRREYQDLLAEIPGRRLHLYATTELLVRQFECLAPERFRLLRYPVEPQIEHLSDGRSLHPTAPHRVGCVGFLRSGRQQDEIAETGRRLDADPATRGRFQWTVRLKRRRRLPRWPGAGCRFERRVSPATPGGPSLIGLPPALAPGDYLDWLRHTDIGLFNYQGAEYFARCSGVLTQMLSAGVPVVVPAGCWLAEQIAETNYEYLDRVTQTEGAIRLESTAVANRDDATNGTCETRLDWSSACCDGEPRMIVVRFRWRAASDPDSHLRLEFEQSDACGETRARTTQIVGRRSAAVPVAIRPAPGACRMRLIWRDAYGTRPAPAEFDSAVAVRRHSPAAPELPLAAVGLTFDQFSEVAALLGEIERHFEHYRENARAFASRYYRLHAPRQVLEQLELRSVPGRAVSPGATSERAA